MAQSWKDNPKAKARAIELFKAGDAATKISRIMLEEFNLKVSRAAVMGMLCRSGITADKREVRPKKKRKDLNGKQHYRPEADPDFVDTQASAEDEKKKGKSLQELGMGMCKWPLRNGVPASELRFCGDHAVLGRSYCHKHRIASLCLEVKPQTRTRD